MTNSPAERGDPTSTPAGSAGASPSTGPGGASAGPSGSSAGGASVAAGSSSTSGSSSSRSAVSPTSATPTSASESGTSTAADQPTATDTAAPQEDLLAHTRVSQTWIGIIIFAIVLILLLIFVLQNTEKVNISYLWLDGRMPLAVAMLLSAVAGVLLTAIAGTLRILQLRRRVKKSLTS